MAEISPMCSIMVASAIGAMTKMADRLNLQRENAGTPTQEAFAMSVKERMAEPSAFVMPMALKINAAI